MEIKLLGSRHRLLASIICSTDNEQLTATLFLNDCLLKDDSLVAVHEYLLGQHQLQGVG